MTLPRLDNLVTAGKLKTEPPARAELEGLIRSGSARIKDAEVATLSLASRFDLAYNPAHALSLAALRYHGYRSENRYIVSASRGTREPQRHLGNVPHRQFAHIPVAAGEAAYGRLVDRSRIL